MKKFILKFLKFILKFFLILVAIVIIINCISFFLKRTNYGQRIALFSYKKIGTYRFKRLAKIKFKNRLSHAVLEENLDQVKKIVSQYRAGDKADAINAKDFAEISALQIAVWLRNKKIMEYLLKNGADIESKNARGETILQDFLNNPLPVYFRVLFPLSFPFHIIMDAGGFGDRFLNVLQLYFLKLLERQVKKTPKEKKFPWGNTFWGESRPWNMLKFLLDKGADINAFSSNILPPIMIAVNWGDSKLIKFLVERGASIKVAIAGVTVLHLVRNLDQAKLFLEKGADVNAVDKRGNTPLHFVRNLDLAKLFLEKGANINAVNKRENTPLHYAMKRNNMKIVEFFLKKGADTDINRPNNRQITPLGLGRLNAVSFLIENYGANITSENITDTFGHACKKGELDIATYILEKRKRDISKKKIPLFLEEIKKEIQKRTDFINEVLQIEKDEEERKELSEELENTTMRYGKIINLLKSLEASQ